MLAESIVGVTDAFGLPTTVTVTGIQQDEPVAAIGSGNTAPDGSGVGTSTAYVRAERAGPGTGRIYFISFTANNTQGAQCSGMVQAFVPHDQGQGFTPVDTGQRYDSTVPAN
jgi:sugar (pentulose or hexulose) kinase